MKVSSAEDFGTIARERRKELNLSQTELAARAGVTRQWLTRFERGNSEVSLSKTFAVLRELDLKVRIDTVDLHHPKPIRRTTFDIPRIESPNIGARDITPNVNITDIMSNIKMTDIMSNIKMTDIMSNIKMTDIMSNIKFSDIMPPIGPATIRPARKNMGAIEAPESLTGDPENE